MINWFKSLTKPAQAGLSAFGFMITCGIVGAILGEGAFVCLLMAGLVGICAYAMASMP